MKNKPFVFVLMPFESSYNDIYKLGIKETCESIDCYCERVDEQIFEERILDRIYNQINKADIVIADLTGKNPNVFYETGYAHALSKKVILLTQNSDDIPFDLKHHHHIIYDGKILKLREELAKRITWFKAHPSKHKIPDDFEIELFINGVKLVPGAKITIRDAHGIYNMTLNHAKEMISLKLDIFNKGLSIFDSVLKIGILTKYYERNSLSEKVQVIKLNDNEYLHLSSDFSRIFPSDWRTLEFLLLSDNLIKKATKDHHLTIRIFTEIGVRDIPIIVDYEQIWGEL